MVEGLRRCVNGLAVLARKLVTQVIHAGLYGGAFIIAEQGKNAFGHGDRCYTEVSGRPRPASSTG